VTFGIYSEGLLCIVFVKWCISEKLWSFVHFTLQNLFPACVWALSLRLRLSGVGTTAVPWCWIGGSAPCSLW